MSPFAAGESDPHEMRIGILTLCKCSEGGITPEWALDLTWPEFHEWLEAAGTLEDRITKAAGK